VLTALAGLVRADRALDDLWARVPVDAQAREQVKTLLESALTEWSGRTGRPRRTIVVFVDDLDRCGDRTALEICEAIKLYLDVPGIAFVLGCDLAVLARVPVPGGADAGHVRGYLEKIIQVNYQIPAPSAESVQAMIHGYAERSGTARLLTGAMTDLVGRQTGGNPRRVKRLLNSFVAEYQLDRGWLDFGTEGLLVAVALQHFYPSFYREILARTDDTVGELLSFAAARQWLATGNEPEPDDDAAEMFLGLRGMMPVENRDPAGRRQITAELDSMVPLEWPVLAGSPDCLELLRDIGDEGARLRLQQRLRRRPLSTSPTPAAPSMAGSELTSLRVLWIDDEPADSGHLRYHVASRGAHVTAVPDVQNAIAALPRFRPNAVLSDVFRDGAETGFDDLRALVEAGYAGPSYFLTSRETPELREKAKRAGADGLSAVPGPVLTWLESLQREIDPRRTGPDSHDSVRP
jgi:CheY-like chemotaxis protein